MSKVLSPPMSIGEVAAHFGVPPWKVRRLYERKLLPAAVRMNGQRVVSPRELPRIEQALLSAGYLSSSVER